MDQATWIPLGNPRFEISDTYIKKLKGVIMSSFIQIPTDFVRNICKNKIKKIESLREQTNQQIINSNRRKIYKRHGFLWMEKTLLKEETDNDVKRRMDQMSYFMRESLNYPCLDNEKEYNTAKQLLKACDFNPNQINVDIKDLDLIT